MFDRDEQEQKMVGLLVWNQAVTLRIRLHTNTHGRHCSLSASHNTTETLVLVFLLQQHVENTLEQYKNFH